MIAKTKGDKFKVRDAESRMENVCISGNICKHDAMEISQNYVGKRKI